MTAETKWPAWIPCQCCGNFLCTIHGVHAHDCECPPVEEWTVDHYAEGGTKVVADWFNGQVEVAP